MRFSFPCTLFQTVTMPACRNICSPRTSVWPWTHGVSSYACCVCLWWYCVWEPCCHCASCCDCYHGVGFRLAVLSLLVPLVLAAAEGCERVRIGLLLLPAGRHLAGIEITWRVYYVHRARMQLFVLYALLRFRVGMPGTALGWLHVGLCQPRQCC